MSLIYDFEQKQDVLLVRLSGELDHHEAEKLKDSWQTFLHNGKTKHVVVNLEHLNFMDSSGLGVFLGRYNEVKDMNGEMVICSINQEVERLFELSGLFKIIETDESEAAALSRLGVAT